MIFYFSGTGNTWWAANELSKAFNEPISSIVEIMKHGEITHTFKAKENEKLFFVFPVHSWGPAVMMLRFLNMLNVEGTNEAYAVCTCGDECGMTDEIFSSALLKKDIKLKGIYSIQMPNDYILMKGFNTDPEELANKKLEAAKSRIDDIVAAINDEAKGKFLYEAGTKKWLKSRIVYPYFKKHVIGKSKFFVDENKCASCSFCQKICPTGNIIMIHNFPVWDNDCVQCTACINRCPTQAIQFGDVTQEKGRYVNPHYGNTIE
ncbi:MAG: EFR1 family ferrodoxin [Bacteroidales bacterium]|nr:EFR1 family ferrodoxin [Bacteroidales bacterium]